MPPRFPAKNSYVIVALNVRKKIGTLEKRGGKGNQTFTVKFVKYLSSFESAKLV